MAAEQVKTKAKREHKSKKRIRDGQEDAEGAEVQRKHKRSKSEKPESVADEDETVPAQQSEPDEAEVPKKKRSKEDKDKKKKKKKDKHSSEEAPSEPSKQPPQDDEMDIDEPAGVSATGHLKQIPQQPFPFFKQTVSRYLPLFPAGMVEPVDGYAEQHLKPLLNRYVREFKGVLLNYRRVRLGEAPNRGSLTEASDMGGDDCDEALLETIDEYAAGFGWLTAEVDLFKPSRGAPLEGVLNMATEGHLGVVCWGMFNASIEASRLPKGWNWVSTLSKNRYKDFRLPTPEPTEEGQEAPEQDGEGEGEGEGEAEKEGDDVTQLYSTGYWADENGQKVEGTVQFRIKNFDVGQSGEYGYLSIEGTMLDADEEHKQAVEELERKRRRDLRGGAASFGARKTRFLPDFSVTKFGADDEEEDQAKRAEIWKGAGPLASRPTVMPFSQFAESQ
ncbi:DNA-directed RNA polymerase I subunit RPA43 [Apiospora kogelbergensis]|uniref:DNA-directed RNA polymerase I subunit RPA43 n=1 Tax=Apiospora kogelbergensis TaxID=1337665 RepID=UPI00312F6035